MRPSKTFWRISATLLAATGIAALTKLVRAHEQAEPGKQMESDRIDEAGLESFPASDPPGWTLGEDEIR